MGTRPGWKQNPVAKEEVRELWVMRSRNKHAITSPWLPPGLSLFSSPWSYKTGEYIVSMSLYLVQEPTYEACGWRIHRAIQALLSFPLGHGGLCFLRNSPSTVVPAWILPCPALVSSPQSILSFFPSCSPSQLQKRTMAWEATYLLSPIVLVLLAPGSWAQDTEVRQAVEGRTVSVDCPYAPGQRFKKKVWCKEISAKTCEILVFSLSPDAQWPKYSMRDHPESHFFTVTMTAVTRRDSGFYFCGITENGRRIFILRTIRLVVSEASPPHMTTWMTTALTSATSPTMESPPDSWTWKVTIAGVAVAILLLLCLVALVLYFRNVRGRAKGVENEGPHIYEDFSGQKKETIGINQQTLSNKDTDTICYASLLHLNHVSHQDSISSGTQPCPKPSPDPLQSVEYAILSRSTLRSSKAAAVEVKTSN